MDHESDLPTEADLKTGSMAAEAPTRQASCVVIEMPDSVPLDAPLTTASPSSMRSQTEVSSSPISLSAIKLTFDPEVSESHTSLSTTPLTSQPDSVSTQSLKSESSNLLRSELKSSNLDSVASLSQDTSELSPSAQPATPNKSSSLDLSSSTSGELTNRPSTETGNSSSSNESCKTPVAPRDEVVITIEDDEEDGEEVIHKSEVDTVTCADDNGAAMDDGKLIK